MRHLLQNLEELILVVVFVLVPVLQRVFVHLKKRRTEVTRSERARRALEDPLPDEPAQAEPRGADLWRELLARVEEPAEEEEEEEEAPPAPPVRPAAARARPPERKPIPTLGGPLATFEPQALGGLSPAPSEDELEGAATAPRVPLAALETLDVHEAVEPLSELPGLVQGAAPRLSEALPRAAGARVAVDWRRAVVLSMILDRPVSLRAPGGLHPGLDGPV